MAKHEKTKSKKIIATIIQLIFWLILIYSSVEIVKWYIHNKQNEEIMDEISSAITIVDIEQEAEIKENYSIDFNALKKVNSDTVAFLKVNGTEVEYPIVKTTNNDFYLKHSFDKTYNAAGWIFTDYKNKLDGTDKNIVIYGHNRKNGTMFSSLRNILNKNWYENEENLKIQLITESENFIYEVFSIYQIEKESYYLQTTFSNNEQYSGFIETLKNRSIKDFNVDVTFEDQILTLSTCANDNNYRVVLHAKKTEKMLKQLKNEKPRNGDISRSFAIIKSILHIS